MKGAVRRWLVSRCRSMVDVDEVTQEAYCRIAALASVDHIKNGRACFFRKADGWRVKKCPAPDLCNTCAIGENFPTI